MTKQEAERPERNHRYNSPAADSERWDLYRPRKGDIIICTPPKCGTTWTQMIAALLVHQTPDLPLPLTRLSRWLDRHSEPIELVIEEYEAQAASFAAMKEHASETAPGAHVGEWTKDSDFFRKGRMGEWRDVLTVENRALFDSVMEQRFSPEARAWIEGGRRVAGDPKDF